MPLPAAVQYGGFELDICLAGAEHLPEILKLVKICTRAMNARGSDQWKEGIYPTPEMLAADIENRNLHILTDAGKIIGIVVVDGNQDKEYETVAWKYTDGKIGFMHRMCIDPKRQKTGLAGKMWEFAENLARQRGFTHMRLDTYSKNKQVQGMIERRRYERAGEVFFPHWDEPYICYEKVL
jgi:GNAT superfamily N-acetyltransferase